MPRIPRSRLVLAYSAVMLVVVLAAGTWLLWGKGGSIFQNRSDCAAASGSVEVGMPVEGRLTPGSLALTEHELTGVDRGRFSKMMHMVEREYVLAAVSVDGFVREYSDAATWAPDAEVRIYHLRSREATAAPTDRPSAVPSGSEYMIIVVGDAGLEIGFR